MAVSIVVKGSESGQRLDALLTNILENYSRGQVQKAIREGGCRIDGQVVTASSRKLRSGQQIELEISPGRTELVPRGEPLLVLWQDENMAAVVKPTDITVHPCPSCQDITLAHRLLGQFPQLGEQGGERPGIVHRLDKDTSGVMVIGLTAWARQTLAQAFACRQVKKKYLALVRGSPPATGECLETIGRHQSIKSRMAVVPENRGGKPARTNWRKLWQGENCALLEVHIATGRTHQIRVHMAHLGWPILGDDTYAPKNVAALAPRQMLHSWQISLAHPVTGQMLHFCVEPPEDFMMCAFEQAQVMLPIVVTGNQGCGKSAFCQDLADAGVPTISADAIVAELYAGNSSVTEWIASYVGPEAITASGTVDKTELFRILQDRPGLRPELERVIHGIVAASIEKFWKANATHPCACAEIPLYFESSLSGMFQPRPLVVGVSCPTVIRRERLAKGRGWSQEKIATMESWQMPEKQKINRCDVIIANDGSREELRKRAAQFLRQQIGERKERLEKDLRSLCACPH